LGANRFIKVSTIGNAIAADVLPIATVFLDKNNPIKKKIKDIKIDTGAKTNMTPALVATPLPPLKLKKTENTLNFVVFLCKRKKTFLLQGTHSMFSAVVIVRLFILPTHCKKRTENYHN
jgi:hypothetical protein